MKKIILIASLILATASYVNSPSFAAGGSKWICFKNDSEIQVTGKSTKEKKANCEKQAGTWTEMVSSDVQKDPIPEVQKQTSGGGGGW
jgi:hypothetical protein